MIRIDNVQAVRFGKTKQHGGQTYRLMTILTSGGTVQIWLEADDRFGEPAVAVHRKLTIHDENNEPEQETTK